MSFLDKGVKTLSLQISPSLRIMGQDTLNALIYEEFLKEDIKKSERRGREKGIRISHKHTGMYVSPINFIYFEAKGSRIEQGKYM